MIILKSDGLLVDLLCFLREHGLNAMSKTAPQGTLL